MNCLECQALLQKRLDGFVPTRERGNETPGSADAGGFVPARELGNETPGSADALERHLNQCPTCREQYAAAQRLLEGVPQLPKPALPANFAREMTAGVVKDRKHRREKLRRRVLVTMALAASVLLTLLGAYWWIPREQPHDPRPKTPFVNIDPKVDEPAPKAPIKAKKQEPKSALAALTDRVADTTRDHAKVVLVATNLDTVERLPAVNDIPMLDPSVREAGQEVSDGVRTVTRSARRAFDFFAREVPMPEIGEQKN